MDGWVDEWVDGRMDGPTGWEGAPDGGKPDPKWPSSHSCLLPLHFLRLLPLELLPDAGNDVAFMGLGQGEEAHTCQTSV